MDSILVNIKEKTQARIFALLGYQPDQYKDAELSSGLFGPRVGYKSIPIQSFSVLILLATAYELTGEVSLIRDLAMVWRDAAREFWAIFFRWTWFANAVPVIHPQFDLLTLSSFGFLLSLLANRRHQKSYLVYYQVSYLDRQSKWQQAVGGAFILLCFVIVNWIFWMPNFLEKISSSEMRLTLLTRLLGVGASVLLGVILLLCFWSFKRFKGRALWPGAMPLASGVLIGTPIVQLWTFGFWPNLPYEAFSNPDRYFVYIFSGLAFALVCLNFIRAWVFFRDILLFTSVIMVSAALLSEMKLPGRDLECWIRHNSPAPERHCAAPSEIKGVGGQVELR